MTWNVETDAQTEQSMMSRVVVNEYNQSYIMILYGLKKGLAPAIKNLTGEQFECNIHKQ